MSCNIYNNFVQLEILALNVENRAHRSSGSEKGLSKYLLYTGGHFGEVISFILEYAIVLLSIEASLKYLFF